LGFDERFMPTTCRKSASLLQLELLVAIALDVIVEFTIEYSFFAKERGAGGSC
jgi:hypothetical protein